jgi:hypothetical protein
MPEPARSAVAADASPAPAHLEIVATAPTTTPREPEQLPLLRVLEIVRDRVESIHSSQRMIAEELRNIRTGLPMQRRPLSRRTPSFIFTLP